MTSIRYSAFGDEEPQRAVVFAYNQRDDVRATFSHGMQLQESLQLAEVQMPGPEDELVRRYEFDYAPSETTGRALLQSVQACAGNGECFVPTQFQYRQPETGFDDIATDIDAPLSDKASPMFFDIDRDGLPDYVVIAVDNDGRGVAALREISSPECSFQQEPQGDCFGGK